MGLTCSSQNDSNKNPKMISYSELDKIIFIEYQYMNDVFQQSEIVPYYPQLNFAELEKEKGDKVKKRHFFKWYDMSYTINKNIFATVPMEMLFQKPKEPDHHSQTEQLDKEEDDKVKENNKEENDNKSEEGVILPPPNEFGISGSEEGLRQYNEENQAHFESRVVKAPPVAFRWLGWLIVTKVPVKRLITPYNNLQTYPLPLEIENQIQKDLTRTLEESHIMITEIKECMYRILKALALVDPEMSYVQGINFICGFLLVISNQNEIDTFYLMMALFSETFSDKFRMREFFTDKFPMIDIYYTVFLRHVQALFPKVAEHIDKITLPHLCWISPWMQMMYVNVFPNEDVLRIWDCLFVYGMNFLISFGLSIVEVIEEDFIKITDLTQMGEYFKLFNPAHKSTITDMEIKYDIEVMLGKAISKYAISEDEIAAEINTKYPNLNQKIIYEYEKFEPYHQPNISNVQNTANTTNIITQEKKDEKEIINTDNNQINNIPTQQELLQNNNNNSMTSEDFEVEEENIVEDKQDHFKDLQKFIGVSMKKTAHIMASKLLNNINK